MMVADTSALMAILLKEQEHQEFLDAMLNDGEVLVSTATAVELMIVAMGKGDAFYQYLLASSINPCCLSILACST